MSYPEFKRFDFHRDGNGHRRDRDAEPRVRLAWISELARDIDTLGGMSPLDAFAIGRAASG